MFNSLAQERRKRMINTVHNKIIRESVLDLVEDEETGETGIDSLGLIMDTDEDVPSDVLDSVEAKVDEAIAGKDVGSMTDEELDSVADQIIGNLNSIEFGK
jgi:hypothetical protein